MVVPNLSFAGIMYHGHKNNEVHSVGKAASYANVVRGTHRNGSDVADVVLQPLVNMVGCKDNNERMKTSHCCLQTEINKESL
jgi:hypothetical protein